jgi:acetolactate synthase-1/2/3 large subunit
MAKAKTTGAKALVKALANQGVEVIFGYPGGATLPIYDELAKSGIRHVLARHEQGAAHMADGYARATGKVGVCMATSGPGATNLVTGLANAYMDSSPIVAITGQVSRSMIGNDAFQEVDITGITIPITKHNYLIQQASEIPHCIQEAFYLASTGRKGPVLLDIPRDVQTEEFSHHQAKYPPLEGYRPTLEGHPGQVKRAVALLKGKGSFPNSHPLCLGLMGYHGRVPSNQAISEADVVLAVGTRFGDRSTGPLATFGRQAKIIHVDIDPAEISKNVPSFLPIVGDARQVLEQLAEQVSEQRHHAWVEHLREVAAEHPLRGRLEGVTIPNILARLREIVRDPVVVTDVGRHQIFTAHYLPVDGCRSWISSGGLGTMGFGTPAAIGAKVGRPERQVVNIAGDGSFMMTCQEVAAAVVEEIPVVILVMNDYCLGMIRQLQDAFYGKRHAACGFGRSVDFAKLAEALGAHGERVTGEEEIVPAIERSLAAGAPAVVDCVLEEPGNVYPMVTGASLLDYVE